MIPWIQVYSNLISHPKTYRLADILNLTSKDTTPNVVAAGLLISLWTWAIQNAYSGDLSTCSDRTIAEAARYKKKPETFVKALYTAGWIDPDRKLHDWDEYARLLMEKEDSRKADTRERVRRYRDKHKKSSDAPCNAPSNAPSNVTVTPCNAPTIPNHTIPIPNYDNSTPNTREVTTPQEVSAPFDGRAFTVFWDAYPRKIGREAAWEAWRKLAPSPDTVARIMSNLEAWKRSGQWTNDGDRYIPKAVNFLSDEGYWGYAPVAPKPTVPTGATGELGGAEIDAIRKIMAAPQEEGL